MDDIILNAEQEAEARDIEDLLLAKARGEIRNMARLLASKSDRQLFGTTEFEIRDRCHRIGAQAFDVALERRKKRGTKGPALPVPTVRKQRSL